MPMTHGKRHESAMHIRLRLFTMLGVSALLSGCIVGTAADVVTAPVRVAGKGVDAMTTSQSEADEKRGRDMRRREERLGKARRDYDRHTRQCRDGNRSACDRARADYADMQELMPASWY